MPKISINKLDEAEFLPQRGPKLKLYKFRSRYSGGTWHDVDNIDPNTRAERIIIKYIGRPFDAAFSLYCKQAPKYQQKFFLEFFEEIVRRVYHQYYIDKNGLIQENYAKNKYKGPYFYKSIDYQSEMRHKITGARMPDYTWNRKGFDINDYHKVIIKGWEKKFNSKRDTEFVRLKTEKQKALSRTWAHQKMARALSDNDFRIILKEGDNDNKAADLDRIVALGFDPVTSFRRV